MKMKIGWSGWGYMAILYHFINRGTQNTDILINTLKYSGTTMNNSAGLMHANLAVTLDEQSYISTKKPSNTGRTKLDKATSYFRASQCLSHVGQNKTASSLHQPIATCGDKSFFSTGTYSAWLYSVFRIFRSETDC